MNSRGAALQLQVSGSASVGPQAFVRHCGSVPWPRRFDSGIRYWACVECTLVFGPL